MEMKHFPTINLEATGKHIAELRKERGLSVKDLQNYFGFDAPQAIYKWQSGTTLPSVDNLLALSALLDVPMESILVTSKPKFTLLTDDEPEGSVFLPIFPHTNLLNFCCSNSFPKTLPYGTLSFGVPQTHRRQR